jgi:hypothetical protein
LRGETKPESEPERARRPRRQVVKLHNPGGFADDVYVEGADRAVRDPVSNVDDGPSRLPIHEVSGVRWRVRLLPRRQPCEPRCALVPRPLPLRQRARPGPRAPAAGGRKGRRILKTLVREKTKTSVVARKLKRTEGATRQKASVLGVKLAGAMQRKSRAPKRP